tara:strand:+ start:47 stop:928 length:882 start_codon:yes stop_codon:yes gene_type:complete
MRIIFIGSLKFSENLLLSLISSSENIVGVISLKSSQFNSDFADISSIAKKYNIDSISIDDINSQETISWITNKSPDIIFCFGWSRLIKKEILDIPKMGILGYHPSLLPSNRGRHPIIWSLVLGLKETGSTFFLMDENADTGDIVSQKRIPINDEDYAIDLYNRLQNSAQNQIKELIPNLKDRTFLKVKQSFTKSNSWRKRSLKDGVIDWRMSSTSIYNLIRALSKPYCGASFKYKDQNIKVWEAKIHNQFSFNDEPGKVIAINSQNIVVKTADGAIKLTKIEPIIKPKMESYL